MIIIEPITHELARPVIEKNHYSHVWTPSFRCFGIYDDSYKANSFFDANELMGVIVYGHPVGRQVVRGMSPLLTDGNKEVWELKRLWVDDRLGKNTESKVIALSIDYIRKHHPEVKCLVSYSDPAQGHNGTIYQATNWLYQKLFDDIEDENNDFYSFDKVRWFHPKSIGMKYGTLKKEELEKILPRPFWTKACLKKHRYIYPLGNKIFRKNFIKSLNHPIAPYPTREAAIEVEVKAYE